MKISKKNFVIIILLILAAFALISACRTIIVHADDDYDDDYKPKPKPKPKPRIRVGSIVVVTGSVERQKNRYYIHDTRSSKSFRVVDLSKSEKKALYKREGDVVKIKLKVVSVESKTFFVARIVKLYY